MATFPTDYQRKCELTVNGALVPSDQSNFPILVGYNINSALNLPTEMLVTGGVNAALSDGGDIRFSSDSAGANQLPLEVEVWVQHASTDASRQAKLWVKGSASTTSNKIYVWYKVAGGIDAQPAANTAYGKYSVWSEYAEVWHMGESSSPNASSKKANNAVWGGSGTGQDTSGKIGNATSFNGSGYSDAATFDGYDNTEDHTFSFWVKPANTTGAAIVQSMPSGGGTSGDGLGQSLSSASKMQVYAKGGATAWGTDDTYGTGSWVHAGYRCTGGVVAATLRLYKNGVGNSTFSQQSGSLTWLANNALAIASFPTHDYRFTGSIQEVRIRSSASTDNWITTEYNNQNSTITFIEVGTPEDNLPSSGIKYLFWW